MSKTPMHNRFAEGFLEPASWGESIDALSSRLLPTYPAAYDAAVLQRAARAARHAAIGAAFAALWRRSRRLLAAAFRLRPLRARFNSWCERRSAAAELYALDDRSLAELGLRRAEIPFIVGLPAPERAPRRARFAVPPKPANHNDKTHDAA